jgi:hypothetical protein
MQRMRSPKNLYYEAELTGDLMSSLYLAATPAKLINDGADGMVSQNRPAEYTTKEGGLERHSAGCPVKVWGARHH